MGFRKTLRLGPLRINLSGSGVSISAGAGPARVVYKLLGAQQGKATLYAFGAPVQSKNLLHDRTRAMVEPTLEDLLRYTRLELEDEERRLERNPRLYQQHKRQHDELYDTLATLADDEAKPYLESWWEKHQVYRPNNRQHNY